MSSFITQPAASWVFSTNSINGVSSSKPNLPSSANPRKTRVRTRKISASLSDSNGESSPSKSSDSSGGSSEDELAAIKDPVKLAFAKAKLYKKSKPSPKQNQAQVRVQDSREAGTGKDGLGSDDVSGEPTKEIPLSVKLAMQKAKEYKKDSGTAGSKNIVEVKENNSGLERANVGNSGYGVPEETFRKKEMSAVSSSDFIGLDFGGKKKGRGLPAGLMPMVDSYPDGDFPEVEMIIGDKSKFERKKPVKSEESDSTVKDDVEVYKPSVSTWGVFPRPSNISKTYGGGRVIRPGDILEESKEKAAKDARTRQLIAAYKSKTGENIDPKLKSECEKALKDGDYLMDVGKLKDALPYYEKVMNELVFQNELHGRAALQWSICQDSLSRQGEARAMYEKLQAHPNFEVRKKASQLLFSFQAMEMMKVTSSSPPTTTGYSDYFDAFLEDKASVPLRVGEENNEEEKEGALRQALPYIIFLISPILFVLVIAARRGT